MSHHKSNGMVWFYTRWREICAIVFLLLVIFDFMIAPTLYEILYKPIPLDEIVTEAQKLSPESQAIFITTAMNSRQHLEWQPLTLGGNGMVYLCFLAILGIASWRQNFPSFPGQNNPPNYPPLPAPTSPVIPPTNPLPPLPNPPPPPTN
jgi:hypothetical protein